MPLSFKFPLSQNSQLTFKPIQGIAVYVLSCLFLMSTTTAFARGLFLNGEDITGARDENLDSVRVRIDEKGDVWISGERYRVTREDHYVPAEKKEMKPSEVVHRLPDLNSTRTEKESAIENEAGKEKLAESGFSEESKKTTAEKNENVPVTQAEKLKQHPPELMMKKEMPAGNNPKQE